LFSFLIGGTDRYQTAERDSRAQSSVDLAGHFSLKPVVQDGRAEAPQSSDLNATDLTVASHFLESLGMDF